MPAAVGDRPNFYRKSEHNDLKRKAGATLIGMGALLALSRRTA